MKFLNNNGDFKFFASANSYNGFESYFGKVFCPEKFDKIFILKGGPGTGKSSLMKRILRIGETCGYYSEAIYCSSDIKSLDGVILNSGKGQIAILDGTAPHTADPQLPGAVDEIVNLGIGWDARLLYEQRDRIIMLNKEKIKAYTKAYENLYISSVFDKKCEAEIKNNFDYKGASIMCEDIISPLLPCSGDLEIRLISSFSKDGFLKLDTLEKSAEELIKISGDGYCEYILMKILCDKLRARDVNLFLFPTPYNTEKIEAIFIPDKKLAITVSEPIGATVDATRYLNKPTDEDFDRYKRLKGSFIEYAKEELKRASRRHFELEDIYIEAMDFSVTEELGDGVEKRCKNILEGAI